MKTNPIRELMRSRVRTLLENCRAAGEVKHGLTVGSLRENYLREFFRDVVPPSFRVASGFVVDADGIMSPQLDFIVYNPGALPPMILGHDLAVLPVESVVLVAEIKSTLTTTDFDQVKAQRAALNSMKVAVPDDAKGEMRIPHAIFALDCKVALTTLRSWLEECGDIMSVCIVGRFFVDRVEGDIQTWSPPEGTFDETLTTIFRLYNGVLNIENMRKTLTFKFEDYMFPEEPENGPTACPKASAGIADKTAG